MSFMKRNSAVSFLMFLLLACSPAWTGPSSSEAKKLVKEFHRAQSSQMKALIHQQRLDLKELKATLKTEFKEIKSKEKENRKKFFEEHSKGSEKREYMKGFIARMKKLESDQSTALDERKKEHARIKEELIKEQKTKREQFESVLKGGTLPDESLWPPKGH